MVKEKLYTKAMDLARQANFEFWDQEPWRPELQAIDWSCDYDEQIVELVRLTVRECAHLSGPDSRVRILDHFGLSR